MSVSAIANPTIDENRNPGTEDWRLSAVQLDAASGTALRSERIEGYASRTSVYPGENIAFHVSASPANECSIEIYRTGYYGGKGGRHMLSLDPVNVTPQTTPGRGPLGIRECNWPESANFKVPDDWQSGVYLAKLSLLDSSAQSYAIFIVKSRQPADLLFQCSDLSWQAYNKWPGRDSLYDHESRKDVFNQYLYTGEDARVSFDRPYALYAQLQRVHETIGSGEFLLNEFPLAYWLEQEGYHVNYCSNLDTDADLGILRQCRVLLSVGHDEYWTQRALDRVTAARDQGMSIAFLTGNALLHAIALEANLASGIQSRNFKRDHRIVNQGRELMGLTTYGPGNGDWTISMADHWIFEGTGLKDGDAITGLVGWEYHGPPFADIPGLEVIALGEVTAYWSKSSGIFGSIVYPGSHGNWVFNAGSIWWSQGLSSPPGHARGASSDSRTLGVDTRVQKITHNFLQRSLRDSKIAFK